MRNLTAVRQAENGEEGGLRRARVDLPATPEPRPAFEFMVSPGNAGGYLHPPALLTTCIPRHCRGLGGSFLDPGPSGRYKRLRRIERLLSKSRNFFFFAGDKPPRYSQS